MIFVIDNGSQYTHVIWRSVRDLGYEVKISPNNTPLVEMKNATGFILSGGPGSAYTDDVGVCKDIVLAVSKGEINAPVLGICLGHQLIAHVLGGKVDKGKSAEYGLMEIQVDAPALLFNGVPESFKAWASHFDEVKQMPPGFKRLAHSEVCEFEAMQHETRPLYSVQFHPEVWHTEHGEKILSNFLVLTK